MRPVLAPASPRLWRDAATLQIGLTGSRSVVLPGLDAADKQLLTLLDGIRTTEQVLAQGRALGCHHPEALLAALEESGLLVDADTFHLTTIDRGERDRLAPDVASLSIVHGGGTTAVLDARRRARVVVSGGGRLGAPLAALLVSAGVGTVDVHDGSPAQPADQVVGGLGPDDLGRPRGEAVTSRLRTAGSTAAPDLVVLTDDQADLSAPVLMRDGVPHLAVRVEGTVGRVGPLVLPGSAACLRCLDLVRSAIDPGWPTLVTQVRTARAADSCDGVLALAVAAQAALQVLQLLAGDTPASVGGTLEQELPDWRWRRRTWPRHPACSCSPASVRAA